MTFEGYCRPGVHGWMDGWMGYGRESDTGHIYTVWVGAGVVTGVRVGKETPGAGTRKAEV